MSSTVIRVENLSKQYRLGKIGTGSFAHDLNRWLHLVRGKEDPYLKVGEVNNRTIKASSDYVWSLKDINFDINKGDAVGIIGRNGAGKSTLLKLLSRTTSPTTGSIKVKGRVASLLEVGTGFHPELSGRENIYLNGAILGMTKKEISKKFDEIVDFSGVERYVDTPVKRYSSGMYVRLAFGVAAHLEPDILIVDEVLAVGDAEFQKKALGKMRDVRDQEGRTVLFVSHNMAAIKNLCNKGILLRNGQLTMIGDIDPVVDSYFLDDSNSNSFDRTVSNEIDFTGFNKLRVVGGNEEGIVKSGDLLQLKFNFISHQKIDSAEIGLVIRDFKGDIIFSCSSRDNGRDYISIGVGEYEINFQFKFPVKHGNYEIDIAMVSKHEIIDQWVCLKKISVVSPLKTVLPDHWQGIINEPSLFDYAESN